MLPMSDERAEGLKMKWPLIDEYVNDFEKLVHLAGYTLGNQETMGSSWRDYPGPLQKQSFIPPVPTTYAA